MSEPKRFRGHIGNEVFEGTIEEWACRTGGTVTSPSTISIDLNKPATFSKPTTLETRFSREGHPDMYIVTAGHKVGKRARAVCAGALQRPLALPVRGGR
jgi:hypothetical protein